MKVYRIFLTLTEGANLAPDGLQRLRLRFSTFSQVAKSIWLSAVVIGLGIAWLYQIGVNIVPLVAGAGFIGIVLSFSAQSLLKDFINGFLILMEDQFGLGDMIVVGEVSGLVENLNLRITQLRDAEGRLITIPNGQIDVVQNLSKEWSRVDLQVTIAPNEDIGESLQLLENIANALYEEPYWQSLILEKPLLLGVDNLDSLGSTLRLWVKTIPLKQWEVGRELRKRIKLAFDQADIAIGIPQQMLQETMSLSNSNALFQTGTWGKLSEVVNPVPPEDA